MANTCSFFISCPFCAENIDIIVTNNLNNVVACAELMETLQQLNKQLQNKIRNLELQEQRNAISRSKSGNPIKNGRAFRKSKQAKKKKYNKRRRCNIKTHKT